jgi:hypothetical protein
MGGSIRQPLIQTIGLDGPSGRGTVTRKKKAGRSDERPAQGDLIMRDQKLTFAPTLK